MEQDGAEAGPTKKFYKGYLNAWSSLEEGVESYFKPAQFFNLKHIAKIQAVDDAELVHMSGQIMLFVLHKSEFDKAVGTISKQPISKLTILEFNEVNELVPLMTIHGIS